MLMCTGRERDLLKKWNEEKAQAEKAAPQADPQKQELGS